MSVSTSCLRLRTSPTRHFQDNIKIITDYTASTTTSAPLKMCTMNCIRRSRSVTVIICH